MQKDALLPSPNPITVLIADDHPATRAGIRSILQETPDIQVVGEAENGFQVQGDDRRITPEYSPA